MVRVEQVGGQPSFFLGTRTCRDKDDGVGEKFVVVVVRGGVVVYHPRLSQHSNYDIFLGMKCPTMHFYSIHKMSSFHDDKLRYLSVKPLNYF